MQKEASNTDWNEIQFLSWSEFKQMAPAILQLEVNRLDRMIRGLLQDTDLHNRLVRARFALKKFIACLAQAEQDTLEETCAPYLRAAIMSFSVQPEDGLHAQERETCRYILDRLNYVNDRIALIY